MELIKKKVERIMTTATTECDIIAEGSCFEFIPDTSVNYNIKILLTAKDIDLGFYDICFPYGYPYNYPYNADECGIGESLLMDDLFI